MKRIVIAAAGTGGHVFPALAVAKKLIAEGWQVDWVGTREARLEAKVVPANGIALHQISMTGVRGHGAKRLLKAPWTLLSAVRQCRALLKQLQPDVVLTFGGYVCAPMGMAARWVGVPLLVHEQNAVAGMTTRLLAPIASLVMLGLPLAKKPLKQAQLVGNPLREEIERLALQAAENNSETADKLSILVVGGSLGAKVLNDVLPQATAKLAMPVNVVHQCGEGNSPAVREGYASQAGNQQHSLSVSDFIDDMASAYCNADLVICRAGALTVSELAALAKPAIFVPLPHAVDDHQTANARVLVDAGAALLLPQAELTAEQLAKQLQSLLQDPDQLWKMARFARQCASPQAALNVAQKCIDSARNRAA